MCGYSSKGLWKFSPNGVATMASATLDQFPVRQGPGSEPAGVELTNKLNDWLQHNGPNGLFRTCGSCRQMRRQGPAHCDRFNQTPPVDIILRGCDQHEDEAVAPY